MERADWAAVVLAGGASTRLGGGDKPLRTVGGQALVTRVLGAVSLASTRVVVGPEALRAAVPSEVSLVCERPPGGGPVAGLAAGLAVVPAATEFVAVLAADLPFLTPEPLALLRLAAGAADGALFVDGTGRLQLLCGVWRAAALRDRLAGAEPAGRSLRGLVDGLMVREVTWPTVATPPWFDCDTEADLRRAREVLE